MKTLKFRSKLIPNILNGRKNVTWRLFDDKNLSVGDELIFIESETGKEFAHAKIIEVKNKKLGEVDETDYSGHEKFANQKETVETYKKYYGDNVSESTEVKIVKFKLI